MFRVARVAPAAARAFHVAAQAEYKVAVLGAAGGIGQPLSLLLKLNPLVTSINLYDIVHAKGVAADLSHIDTAAKVTGFVGADQLADAVKNVDLVVIPAGVPRKPGMTRDDLFNTNAKIVQDLIDATGKNSPKALIAIISNPVNSTVPIAAEVLKKLGVYDAKKVFGVTTLDILRANTFVAEAKKLDPTKVSVPVVGGHAGGTILPLLSQTTPKLTFTDEERNKLTLRIQNGGTEVVDAKQGAGSATLSMAQAANRFATSLLKGLRGDANVVEYAYVENPKSPSKFFSEAVLLGKNGVEKYLGTGALNAFESEKLTKEVIPELNSSIVKGEKFVNK